jgi:hypothetical protein
MGGLGLLLGVAPKPWSALTGPGFFATPERSIVETVLVAGWWAGVANLVLLAALWGTARLWLAPSAPPRPGPAPPRVGRVFVALVLAAVALAAALRLPLAEKSLWWDELWSLKRVMVGYHEPDPDDPERLVFHAVRPHWTLWHYKKPTNHVLYSAAARISNAGWRLATGAEAGAFDELALRLPALLASLLAVAGVAFLAREWGFPRAGVAAAFLLALHPWHVRHGSEARGYGFVVLGTIAACWLLTRALTSDRWRYWGPYAVVVWLLFWTHPFTAYLTGSLAVFAGVGIATAPRERRAAGLARLAAVHVLAAVAVLAVMAPNLAQTALFTDINAPSAGRVVRPGQVKMVVAGLVTGLPRSNPRREPDRAGFPSVRDRAEQHAWLTPVVYAGLPLLLLVGLFGVVRRGGPGRWVAPGLVAAAPLALGAAWFGDQFFHPRFVMYGLVPVALFLPIGIETLLGAAARGRPQRERTLVIVGLAAGVAAFAAFVAAQDALLVRRPIAPMRDAAALARGDAGAAPGDALRLGYGLGGDLLQLYDPWIVHVTSADDVAQQVARARAEERPLYVVYGHPGHNRTRFGDGFRYLDDPALFQELGRFDGVEPRFTFRVLRYTGAPLDAS